MNGLEAGVALLPDPNAKEGVLGLGVLSVLNVFKGAGVEPPLLELPPNTNGWPAVDAFDPNAPALAGFIDALLGAPKVKAGVVTTLGPLLLSKGFLEASAFVTVVGVVPKGELVPFTVLDLLNYYLKLPQRGWQVRLVYLRPCSHLDYQRKSLQKLARRWKQ